MSEIKTYKCDICKKVFHANKTDTAVILAIKSYSEDSADTSAYEDICPDCANKLISFTKDPYIVDKLKQECSELKRGKYDLRYMIKAVRDKICEYEAFYDFSVERHIRMCKDEIIEKYLLVCKHRDIYRSLAIIFGASWISYFVISLI